MITRKQRNPVHPSSNDAILSWLDVLTSMLSLSESKRMQVRDELEDHLRSRVDDLLITGLEEHQAVKQAVSELGETAQLAKVVTNAHTHTTPRRRTMQTILIAGALAGMSFGGFTLINNTVGTNHSSSASGAAVMVEKQDDSSRMVELSIEQLPTLMAFDEVSRAFGYTLNLDTLEQSVVSDLQHRPVDIKGTFTLDQAIQALRVQTLQYASVLHAEVGNGSVELLTRDEKIRRSISTRVFRLREADKDAIYLARETLGELIEPSADMRWVSISTVGNGVVIAAPPATLANAEQAWGLIVDLHAEAIDAQRAQAESLNAKRERASEEERHIANQRAELYNLQREQAIETLREVYETVRAEMLASEDQLSALSRNRRDLGIWTTRSGHEGGLTKDEFNIQSLQIDKEERMLSLRITEAKLRYEFLRDSLIETEYASMFENLPIRP